MRPDMAKKLVERPRFGHFMRNAEVRYQRRLVRQQDWDDLPRFSSMKPKGRKWIRKELNENFAPLLRYLGSCDGKAWDEVYSEIRANLDTRSATGLHILQHVEDWVDQNVIERDGKVYTVVHRDGRPLLLNRSRFSFYVDDQGIFHRVEKIVEEFLERTPREEYLRVVQDRIFFRKEGIWYEIAQIDETDRSQCLKPCFVGNRLNYHERRMITRPRDGFARFYVKKQISRSLLRRFGLVNEVNYVSF